MGNNGNRTSSPKYHARGDVIELCYRLLGQGAAAPIDLDAGQMGTEIASISRTSTGLYVITPNRSYNGEVVGASIVHAGTLDGATIKFTSLNLGTPTFSLYVTKLGSAKVQAWTTAAVAVDTTGALAAGTVVAVDLTAGGVVGGGHLKSSAPVVTREVQVSYTAGVPTLNFLAADAVTECKYLHIPNEEQIADLTSNDAVYVTISVRTKTRN